MLDLYNIRSLFMGGVDWDEDEDPDIYEDPLDDDNPYDDFSGDDEEEEEEEILTPPPFPWTLCQGL